MFSRIKQILSSIVLTLTVVLLTACGAPPPADFGGDWTPVNRFQEKPQAIPLSPAYTYYASPLDGTLRGMLRRWANDTAMPLVWQMGSDYTLYKAAADLRATSLQAAISQINKIYAAQGVLITADAERILVQQTGAPSPAPSASSPASSTATTEHTTPASSALSASSEPDQAASSH